MHRKDEDKTHSLNSTFLKSGAAWDYFLSGLFVFVVVVCFLRQGLSMQLRLALNL
jgi:hypothetical protein